MECPSGLATADLWTVSAGLDQLLEELLQLCSSSRRTWINPLLCLCRSRFVNFRDNPLTLTVTLASKKTKTLDDQEEDEEDREMFGRDFMLTYIQEARKRSHTAVHVHQASTVTDASAPPPGHNSNHS